jgi:hypothetical protein
MFNNKLFKYFIPVTFDQWCDDAYVSSVCVLDFFWYFSNKTALIV